MSYHGGAYQGWQSQSSGKTVQDHLESALGSLAAERVSTVCAGRTDAGVHALMQVVHFDTNASRRLMSWVRGTNALLPRDIAVQWAAEVPEEFHCRAAARSRRYTYVLLESAVRPSIDSGRVGWVLHALNHQAMQESCTHLIGEHDFTSFRAAACQALSATKKLIRIDISRRGAYWRFEFEASAFLHHMVRNIVGALIQIGQGRQPVEFMAALLAFKDRTKGSPTFSPDGLYLTEVSYPPGALLQRQGIGLG